MSAIVLGQNLITNKPVKFDVAAFLRSRLLCCASSGGGKSWTLRRLLEQTHRIVQQIVIDLEDEFYTLREKHDYVLGRPDGDFAVTVQSAELLARTLLETKVSAIISLAELPLHERPIFVKKFLNALVNAPRSLWHSVLVVVDEAHLFCLDEETEILTVEGWRRHDQIGPGTVAVAFDIANAEYRYEEVSNVIRKQHRGKMVVLKSTVAHVAIDEETGFKRSTRDAYLSRMEAKQIVVRAPGVAAASPNLF